MLNKEARRCWIWVIRRMVPGLVIAGVTASAAIATVHRVPEDHAVIQAALDACADGDTVLIGPGTYRGPGNRELIPRDRDIVIKSSSGALATTIDCELAGRGFYVRDYLGADNVRIEGLTVTNGNSSDGGAISSGVSAEIVDCRLIWNYADVGGGLSVGGLAVLVHRCEIGMNWGDYGGGINYSGGNVDFVDCLISHNWSVRGGAMAFSFTGPYLTRLRGCTITGNFAFQDGGGFYGGDPVVLEECILWGNCSAMGAQEWGGCDAQFLCCDVNLSGVSGDEYTLDEYCIFTDPRYCAPAECGRHEGGDYSLHADSPCLPESSPCGRRIGAFGAGCGWPPPEGACCFEDGSCLVLTEEQCTSQQGSYLGDGRLCEPDPCNPTRIELDTLGRIRARFRGD